MHYINSGLNDTLVGLIILVICAEIILHLYLVCPLLWICFFFSVCKKYIVRKKNKKKEDKAFYQDIMFKKFLKNWIVWFFLLLLPQGAVLYMPDIAEIIAYSGYTYDFFPTTHFFTLTMPAIFVLAIPYGYFSMVFYENAKKKKQG